MISGSVLIAECNKRLETLCKDSHKWLLNMALAVTKDRDAADDLVQELYLYLAEKCNPAIFWGNSYNIMYCQQYLKTRWINKQKRNSKILFKEEIYSEEVDIPYDVEKDIGIQQAFDDVMHELKHLETTKMWPASRIFQLYWMSDRTLDSVAKDIKISKSTTFLAVKKIRQHLKEVINNPYNEN